MLSIPPDVIAAMQRHAFAGYPGEAVGLLVGVGEAATRAIPLENIQDKLHALDPVEHPRTSRNGFQINVRKMEKAVEEAAARGERLLAIFHSHIDCGAYFSQEDQDMAAPPPERVPMDPSLWHVVMACYGDGMREANAFRWDGKGFAAHPLSGFARAVPLPQKA